MIVMTVEGMSIVGTTITGGTTGAETDMATEKRIWSGTDIGIGRGGTMNGMTGTEVEKGIGRSLLQQPKVSSAFKGGTSLLTV